MRQSFFGYSKFKKLIENTNVGDEGGFAPNLDSNDQAIELIIKAIKKSGFKEGEDISICLDIAANELKENQYH